MIKTLCLTLMSGLFLLACNQDPSTLLEKRKDKTIVDKKGSISTYNPAVDILFIIDDSGSMRSYQDRLATNADLFVQKFLDAKFIDYHIGVTTSSDDAFSTGSNAPNGKLHLVAGKSYVSRQDSNGYGLLMQMLNVGDQGSGTEKFLNIPQKTLSVSAQKGFNLGFFRPDAHLMIFVLTDTYDQSQVMPKSTYKFLLDLKKGDHTKLHFGGALVSIEKKNCQAETDDDQVNLRKFASFFQSRGYLFNICQSDYGEDLARVARNVVDAVSTVYLDNVPDITTMSVYYGEQKIPNQKEGGWTYDYNLNAIHLSPDIDVRGGAGDKLNIRFAEIYAPEPQ